MARFTFPKPGPSKLAIPLALATVAFALTVTPAAAQFPGARPPVSKPPTQAASQLTETVTRDGPFTVAGQQYAVLFHYAVVSAANTPAARAPSTLSSLEILDSQGNRIYQETFTYTLAQQRFADQLRASASLLSGDGGVVLLIRFLDRPAVAPNAVPEPATESWQLFAVVDGHLTLLDTALPVGGGSDITVGGAVAAVMMRGGIAVMPMASTAEVLAFRAWTGSFYALVPMRFDWAHGQWGEGQQCYQTANGTLTERGCIMRLEAKPQPRPPDADTVYVQLFVAPDGDTDNSLTIPVSPDARVEILEMQAIVRWETPDQRVVCSFQNVWLRTRINDQEGWVRGQQAFDALGLPLTNPQ